MIVDLRKQITPDLEVRLYRGEGPPSWRLFLRGDFVFSADTLAKVERHARLYRA